jgi:hypothetical protein
VEHLAIDLGGKESQICLRGTDGHIVEQRRCATAALTGYLASRPKSRVVVETCNEALAVADAALSVGHEVRVVPATLVRTLDVGARRWKPTGVMHGFSVRRRAASTCRRCRC